MECNSEEEIGNMIKFIRSHKGLGVSDARLIQINRPYPGRGYKKAIKTNCSISYYSDEYNMFKLYSFNK